MASPRVIAMKQAQAQEEMVQQIQTIHAALADLKNEVSTLSTQLDRVLALVTPVTPPPTGSTAKKDK